ncbi:Qat anti-phage system QueC-like protein QatC [Roseivivax sp. THAF30]|uniref:Qat anti-phage system QueC-like protein QatC n=1 Tax=Roseivivax sp. THAF30 TaxID=2587852 RepID=UPI00156245FF|nr:Qat anti-phage system QueC-like protein QatC [Roseivivax sp. THAF30]
MRRLEGTISPRAFDFLSIALSAVTADVLVPRAVASNGFSRSIELTTSVQDTAFWIAQASNLERTLNFLTGDNWSMSFTGEGRSAPTTASRKGLRQRTKLLDADCVCLFSGGLDSLLGAVELIEDANRSPLLVSRESTGDKQFQTYLRSHLPSRPHLGANDALRGPEVQYGVYSREDTTRARSLLFLAMGTCVASAIANRDGLLSSAGRVTLYIPENGFIALNPPLSPRRLGALSTRTAHPEFLSGIQRLLDAGDIPVTIKNPFRHMTKGEMLHGSSNLPLAHRLAAETVSCGRWKRKRMQCGHCVPCLIRRAAFHASNVTDRTKYWLGDLGQVMDKPDRRTDLLSVIYAIKRSRTEGIARWVIRAGTLPTDSGERTELLKVAERGRDELAAFIRSEGIPV